MFTSSTIGYYFGDHFKKLMTAPEKGHNSFFHFQDYPKERINDGGASA
jgi:hypothetical protein